MASDGSESLLAELARNYVDSTTKATQKDLISRISEAISAREAAGLLDLVEILGLYLTNDDVQMRRKGSQLLAELIHRLDAKFLTDKESELLSLFFIDRLKDHHSIQPQVIYGLLGLVSYFNVSDENIIKICQSVFAEVHVQSLLQADRRNVFNLFANMLEKYIRPLRRMGPDFVLGLIQSIDGEKDPRNLLVCFQNVQQIVSKLPFEVFAEDLFEVTSCYFPIDFIPPPNNPHGITKEELVMQLRNCLASTHVFAPFCMPLLLEKITSDVVDAKIDAHLTLAACAKVYKPEDFNDYYKDIWNAIRGDYLLGGIKAIENACVDALKGTAMCLSRNPGMCKDFVDLVLNDCEQGLKDPDLNLHKQLSHIVVAIVFSCADVFEMTFTRIMKLLESLINSSQSNVNTAALVQILHRLLHHPFLEDQNNVSLSATFAQEQNTVAYLITVLSSSDVSTQLICNSFQCLLVLMFHGCLSKSDSEIFFERMLQRINSDNDVHILQTIFNCMSLIVERNVEPSPGYICDLLQINIKNAVCHQHYHDDAKMLKIRNNFGALYATLHKTDDVVSVANMLFQNLSCNDLDFTAVKFLFKAIDKFPETADKLENKLIPILLTIIDNNINYCDNDDEMWNWVMKLFRTMISNLSHQLQNMWLQQLISRYILEKENLQGSALLDSNTERRFSFISSFLCAAGASNKIFNLQDVILWLQQKILQPNNQKSVEYGCKSFASLVNKMPEGEALRQNLVSISEHIEKLLSDGETEMRIKENATLMLIWITKSVVLRWNDIASLLLKKLLSLIPDESVGRNICENMFILMKEYDDCLNADLHAKIRIMYKQRLIDFLLPKLVELYKISNEFTKSSISKAISCLFQQLPKQIVQKQLLPIIPLLIHSLSMSDVSVLSSTLSTFNSLDNPTVLKNHVTSIIPRLLSLAQIPESMNLRMQAIKCLMFLSLLPVHCIYPYQMNVIRSLKSCLDDRKRVVRKEAFKCRNHWYLLSQSD